MAMVARNGTGLSSQQLEEGLKSSDSSTRLRAVRQLKNTVIGNRFKKQQFTELVPALLELLASSSDTELVVQAVAALGSLAYGSDERVVVAAARSLKLLYQTSTVVAAGAVPALVQLLASQRRSCQLGPVCASALPHLVRLLAVVDAAAAGAGASHGTNTAAAAGSAGYRALLGLGGEAGDSRYLQQVRPPPASYGLGAIKLLVKVLASKAAGEPGANDATAAAAPATKASSSSKAPPASTAVAAARASAAAAAAGAAAAAAVRLRRGCLAALAALAMHGEAARQKVAAEQGGRLLQLAWLRWAMQTQGARLLRGGGIPAAVAAPLVALLQDAGASEVQVAAAGAVCNLLLAFSSVRQPLIKAGVLQALLPLTTSMLPELRLYSVWALKNAAHEAEAEVQQQLLGELSWQGFRALLVCDDDMRVQGQAVGLLQNLCKGTAGVEQASLEGLSADLRKSTPAAVHLQQQAVQQESHAQLPQTSAYIPSHLHRQPSRHAPDRWRAVA
ncbi:armadillo-type protein [Scenedesmus sp. NREL 46B-D3]|nr:armadillo-type protein [Scenedesmus sp. NREL 46B-D3]